MYMEESVKTSFSASEDTETVGATVTNRKEVSGTVTHVFSNHGLIDNEIYFSFDNVVGGCRPSVGTNVSVVAVQQYDDGGWHAEQVSVSEDWEEEDEDQADGDKSGEDLSYPTDIVGVVTHISERTGYVNDITYFDLAQCHCDDFVPCKGDWVKVKVLYPEDKWKPVALSLQPVRMRVQTEGVISAVMEDHGYIDGDAFFLLEALVNNYRPRKWDSVYYTAVESNQGRCSWRATKIEPSQKPGVIK